MNNLNKKIGSFFTVELISENILFIKLKSKTKISLENVKELINLTLSLVEDECYHSIVDVSESSSGISSEARNFMKNFEDQNNKKLSQSLIFNSVSKAFIVGMFFHFVKINSPSKTFSNIDAALKWIDTLK